MLLLRQLSLPPGAEKIGMKRFETNLQDGRADFDQSGTTSNLQRRYAGRDVAAAVRLPGSARPSRGRP